MKKNKSNFMSEIIKSEVVFETIIKPKTSKKNMKFILIFSVIIFLSIGGYILYQKLSITEKDARENANRLFAMMSMKNLDSKLVEEIYPNFSKIENYIIFKHKCIITNISKNSEGDFEVYANYKFNARNIYPIFLIIGKKENKIIIKSSKGLSYANYNKLLEYGKNSGCLVGNENDVEMSVIIKNNNLKESFDNDIAIKYSEIKRKIEIESNIDARGFGYLNGNINLINNNNIDLSSLDFECILSLYDIDLNVVNSQKIYFHQGINSNSSASSNVMSSSNNSVKFKVDINLKEEYGLSSKIETLVVQEATNYCK